MSLNSFNSVWGKVVVSNTFSMSSHVMQPCVRTQLDFMAEQCSQTDMLPLYLLPNTASFYTWIPALGFVKGRHQKFLLSLSETKTTFSNMLFFF